MLQHRLNPSPLPQAPLLTRKPPRKSTLLPPPYLKTSASSNAVLKTLSSPFHHFQLTHLPSHLAHASPKNASMTSISIASTSFGLKNSNLLSMSSSSMRKPY